MGSGESIFKLFYLEEFFSIQRHVMWENFCQISKCQVWSRFLLSKFRFTHMSHSKGLSPSWTDAISALKLPFYVNFDSHMSHSKVFFLSWINAMWSFNFSFEVNVDSHMSHSLLHELMQCSCSLHEWWNNWICELGTSFMY